MSSHRHEELEGIDGRGKSRQSYSENSIGGSANVQFGNQYFYGTEPPSSTSIAKSLEHGFSFRHSMGLCLNQSPYIDSRLFIGRESEISQIHGMLEPSKSSMEQRRLVLGGIGGIGKTQLAIAYAKQHQRTYDSVFWLNATDETTLKTSYQSIAERIIDIRNHQAVTPNQVSVHVKRWLSDAKNSRWLLIFDNYDEPELYNIESYFPYTSHGSIIITTRLPSKVSGQSLLIQPLGQTKHGLQILETRSQRSDVADDPQAQRLTERLAGLPLALATAGAYLHKSTWSFQRYLEEYENRWEITSQKPPRLQEYQGRTLYTTWGLSYRRLRQEDAEAGQLLKLLAYFDHQAIWYELFQANSRTNQPNWISAVAGDFGRFESVMRVLVDYCFLEIQTMTQSYSMHTCVHDWTLTDLNNAIEPWSYWYAFDCVANSIYEEELEFLGYARYARLTAHAIRLTHSRFYKIGHEIPDDRLDKVAYIAQLLSKQFQFAAATIMYTRALAGKEKVLGPDHISTLDTINHFGTMYLGSGKLDQAEVMYERALAGNRKTLGSDHISTLSTVHNLGILYIDQHKLDLAEEMLVLALTGREKVLGPDHKLTIDTVNNLGNVYRRQGKHDLAEKMLVRASRSNEKTLEPDHILIFDTFNNFGNLYVDQNKLDLAEEMLERALTGRTKTLGLEHVSTLFTVNNLGNLYRKQGKLDLAEEMYNRALAGSEKALGSCHGSTTLFMVYNLSLLYVDQGKLDQAEVMYKRTLAGHEKMLGPDHMLTLDIVDGLGNLYRKQGKLDLAEEMLVRALIGTEKALGPDHNFTLDTAHNLGNLYLDQGKLDLSEEMYKRALAGSEKTLGSEHKSTLSTVHNLGLLYMDQGKLALAEEMLRRALAGRDKTLGTDHESTIQTADSLRNLHWRQSELLNEI